MEYVSSFTEYLWHDYNMSMQKCSLWYRWDFHVGTSADVCLSIDWCCLITWTTKSQSVYKILNNTSSETGKLRKTSNMLPIQQHAASSTRKGALSNGGKNCFSRLSAKLWQVEKTKWRLLLGKCIKISDETNVTKTRENMSIHLKFLNIQTLILTHIVIFLRSLYYVTFYITSLWKKV